MLHSKLIIKGSALSVAQVFLQVAVAFFMMPFVIAHLGTRFYGIWILIGAFVGYYGLLDLGISSAVMRYVSRSIGSGNREKTKYYVSSAFFVLCAVGVLVVAVSIAASFFAVFFIHNSDDLFLFKFSVIILGFAIGISFPLRVFDGVLNANLRVDLKRYIEIGEIIVRTILVVAVLEMGFGILGLAVVSASVMLTDFIVKAVVAFKIDPTLRIKIKYFNKDKINEMKDFAFFNFIRAIADILSNKIDPYTVAYFTNISAVAYYGVALNLANYFAQFFKSFLGILAPLFSQKEGANDIEGIRRILVFVSGLSVIISTFMVTLIIFYSRQFLTRWLGPSFNESYIIVILLVSPFILAYGFFSSVFVLGNMGKHRLNAYLDIIQGVVNLVLSILLGFFWGTTGIALGTAIPLIVLSGFARSYFACRIVGMAPLVYWKKMFLILIRSEILIIPVWFLFGRYVESNYSSLLLIFFIHLVVFIIGGY
ncbi:MAG: oligosaccharide flippase family protein, partial [Deltaproteobacteria bacterium]|nr:oligosaccharide flippase family protein [Deltaproteobacteria bacterium]